GEPGCQRGSTRLDHARVAAGERCEFAAATHGDDSSVGDPDRVGAGRNPARAPQPRATHEQRGGGHACGPETTFTSTPTPSTSTSMRSPTATGAMPAGV